LFFSV
jgi:serine/threonine-protein phosphatase 2A regulatory subunit A